MKSVLHVVNSLDCGGLENFAIDLCKSVKRRGWRPQICCLKGEGELADRARRADLPITLIGGCSGVDLGAIFRLRKFIAAEQFDIVHTHNMAPLIYGTIAGRLARVGGMVHTRHGREPKSTYRFIWALNDAVVAISEDAAQRLMQVNRIRPSKVSTILNGVDVSAYESAPREEVAATLAELGLEQGSRVVGIVARLAVEKDHQTLLNAFELVAKACPSAQLLIVGDGPLLAELKAQSGALDLQERVHFLGFRDDIPRVMRSFDVFVLSSTTEGLSLTLLEAMAAAKPIVATRVGGNPEVVVDGETGFIVDAKDPKAMSEKVLMLLNDMALAESMGAAGHNRVSSVYGIEAMTDQYLKIYAQSLQ